MDAEGEPRDGGRVRGPSELASADDAAGGAVARGAEEVSDVEARLVYLYSEPLVWTRDPSRGGGGVLEEVDTLDFQAEKRSLKSTLKRVSRDLGMRVTWKEQPATVTNFARAVRWARGKSMLHFAGHGLPAQRGAPAVLTFEDDNGELCRMPPADLADLFSSNRGAPSVRCVFVSACHSEQVGIAFAAAGVPHVVAVHMEARVEDGASIKFADEFYDAILSGETVAGAFESAKTTIKHDPLVSAFEEEHFRLLGSSEDHSEVIFAPGPSSSGSFHHDTASRHNDVQRPVFPFVGRGPCVSEAYRCLRSEAVRCVTVVGAAGVGKTQVVRRVAHYASERDLYERVFNVELGRSRASWAELEVEFTSTFGLPSEIASEKFDHFVSQRFSGASGGRYLCVLQGVDALRGDVAGWREFMSFLSRLVSRATSLQLLVASSGALDLLMESREVVVEVPPLAQWASADLLFRFTNRKLLFAELGLDSRATERECLSAFADSAVVRALKGHPGAIRQLASKLGGESGSVGYRLDDPTLLSEVIPSILRTYDRTVVKTKRASSTDVLRSFAPATPEAAVIPTRESLQILREAVAHDEDGIKFWLDASFMHAGGAVSSREHRTGILRLVASGMAAAEGLGGAGGDGAGVATVGAPDATLDASLADARASMPDPRTPIPVTSQSQWGKSSSPIAPPPFVSRAESLPAATEFLESATTTRQRRSTSHAADATMTDVSRPVPWAVICVVFQKWFEQYAPDGAKARPLEDADFEFLRCSPTLTMVDDDGNVPLHAFAARWRGLHGWLCSMRHLQHDWMRRAPTRITGWINRDTAFRMLSECDVGTFLVRFSESSPSKIVVCVILDQAGAKQMTQLQTEVLPAGLRLPLKHPDGSTVLEMFDSLTQMVQRYQAMRFLYPNIPKEFEFATRPT